MYESMLYLHSYTRWLVLLVLVWALWRMWHGLLTGRPWTTQDRVAGLTLAIVTSLQFIFGLVVHAAEGGLGRIAMGDIAGAMAVRELRFFGFEHPVLMTIALALLHLGAARAKRAATTRGQFRWGTICFTLGTVLILGAIPWERPLLRVPTSLAARTQPTADVTALPTGDAARGATLFAEAVDGAAPCSVCHAVTDETLVGSGLANIGSVASERVEGESAAQYLYNSIVYPAAYIVTDYPNVMPPNYGDVLTQQQVADLIAYLMTLQ